MFRRRHIRICIVIGLVLVGMHARAAPEASPRYVAVFAELDHLLLLDDQNHLSAIRPGGGGRYQTAALSRDGSTLAFTVMNPKSECAELFVATQPFKDAERIGATSGHHRDPTFTPDGKKVIFALHVNSTWGDRFLPGHNAQLFEEELGTRQIHALSNNGMCHHLPSLVGPAGDRVLFTKTDCQTQWRLAELDLRTGDEHDVTHGRHDTAASVSPDGASYAFIRATEGNRAALLVADSDKDGGKRAPVAQVVGLDPQIQWLSSHEIVWWSESAVWRKDLDAKGKPQRLGEVP